MDVAAGTVLLLNPPYGRVPAPHDIAWTSGLTTEAALFLYSLVNRMPTGAFVAAVLPEVLRAGSRYDRFRSVVARYLAIQAVIPAGRFDALTDVDVFLLAGAVRPSEGSNVRWTPEAGGPRLEDVCDVRIGPLVAYREPHLGPWRRYIDASTRGLGRDVRPESCRRFRGTVFEPPFVVVGRTNRPVSGPGPRLRATIVRGNDPVAVENHLVVLIPHDHTIRGCRCLVRIVESGRASAFLDRRLRCRHLTVEAVRNIPR